MGQTPIRTYTPHLFDASLIRPLGKSRIPPPNNFLNNFPNNFPDIVFSQLKLA
jgi:hypothetical protein